MDVGALIAIVAVIALIEVALLVWAVVDIARRTQTALLPRWGWLLVVLLLNGIGPIVYLIAGRGEPTPDAEQARTGQQAERAVDVLYGPAGDTHEQPSAGHGESGRERPPL